MEQFIGSDAHKKFSVFVAVNEKRQAGTAMRAAHARELYWEFLARLPARSGTTAGWWTRSSAQATAPAVQATGGQTAHGAHQEEGQVGCQELSYSTSQWQCAGSMDSAERTTGSTRTATPAPLSRAFTDKSQKSDPRHPGTSQYSSARGRSSSVSKLVYGSRGCRICKFTVVRPSSRS
jgi:hypothetical protein